MSVLVLHKLRCVRRREYMRVMLKKFHQVFCDMCDSLKSGPLLPAVSERSLAELERNGWSRA